VMKLSTTREPRPMLREGKTESDRVAGSRKAPSASPRPLAPSKIQTSRTTPFIYRWCLDSWLLEYLSLAISLASLVAIFTVLFLFHNEPYSKWQSEIGINAVLSIIATVLKGTPLLATASALGQLKWMWYHDTSRPLRDLQIFDSASRGPFGAICLLLRLPRSFLACIGCFVILLSLGSDASIQASTIQPLKSQSFLTTSMPVGKHYHGRSGNRRIDPVMQYALYTSVSNSQILLNNAM
jgi:hypothetical protein